MLRFARPMLIVVAVLVNAVMVLPALGVSPAKPAVDAEINQHYMDADAERWKGVFEREGRELFDRRLQIVDALKLQPGESVADIGAGTGLFTMLFAERVGPNGQVYAVDISPSFIAAIDARANALGLGNILPIVNSQQTVSLPAKSVDLVFIADTYHHFEYPQLMLDSIRAALRPGGRLVLIDFRREPGFSSSWVMAHVRAGRAQVISELEAAGFKLVEEPLALQGHYFLLFR
ncbi:MAG: class I SAM-dependent methyltransferase [Lamprobacter sp.]|uniref:class I SAM-dependent methyltransferase n=1 Tax=Lamprobacter sp. TaxID=3100796 RepID=UPI002B26277D|nr:class I SAM-dependent methyltransferase [Lamprobacter sp.]MEA3640948.1 class I SAM-dependent methyltransferase [Lamprobacter sp.]